MKNITTLVLASGNKGKLAELQELCAPLDIIVRPQSDFGVEDVEETGTTFVENAILKAKHASKVANVPALADDSGLCVNAFDGAPGLYSARYALLNGHDEKSDALNNQVLLEKLTTTDDRSAYFVCCLALCFSATHPLPLISIGRWHGTIAHNATGENGFGYDPLFIPDGKTVSAAALDKSEKQTLSHRGQALRGLIEQLS